MAHGFAHPVLRTLVRADHKLVIYAQDDPTFPADLDVIDDTSLEQSFRRDVQYIRRPKPGAGGAG